ncbi:MAG: glycosyltransferase family 39 protein [Candidatus Zixiibacteriota bacterium]
MNGTEKARQRSGIAGSFAAQARRLAASTQRLGRSAPWRRLTWGAVAQVIVDVLVYRISLVSGGSAGASHIVSFAFGLLVSSLWISTGVRRSVHGVRPATVAVRLAYVGLAALFLRGGILALASRHEPGTAWFAIIPAALAAAAITVSGQAFIAAAHSPARLPRRTRRRLVMAAAIVYLLALRLVYIGGTEVIPEEAYYWNYAQHLDWSYLDHPPMVAWIIGLGSAVFGATAFGVRIGAWLCWLLTAGFAFGLARELFGRPAATVMLFLVSVLPFFFGTALVMTPDAPVTAAWAATLYFLARACLRNDRAAWLGAGVSLGLGLLSKYTIALLIPATMLFMLWDAMARLWWRRPQPYLALALAGVLFLPVIWWNSQHDWVSFLFQTAGRLQETAHFSLHELLGAALVLLTPTGLWAAVVALVAGFGKAGERTDPSPDPPAADRPLPEGEVITRFRIPGAGRSAGRHRFMVSFTLVPLAVFTIFSLTHHTKLNWTGPTWLAVLPAVAAMLTCGNGSGRWRMIVRRLWTPTCVTLVLLYGALLHYIAVGFPGVRYPAITADVAGWSSLQEQVSAVADRLTTSTNRKPLIVGTDRYNIASELAFYGHPDGPQQVAGRHLFDQNALMYRDWFPARQQEGKNMILVGRRPSQLETETVVSRFDSLGSVDALPVRWNGQVLREYYYRVGYGYRPGDH